MSRPRDVIGRTFELAQPYEGHPAGTRWTTKSVEFDLWTGELHAMDVCLADGTTERWAKPGCWSVEVEADSEDYTREKMKLEGETMFDFKQLHDLDTAVCSHRHALRRKREQLAKRPIGRNYVARERQLKAMDEEVERMTQLILDIRAAIRPHIDQISAQLSA